MSYKFVLTTHSKTMAECINQFGLEGTLDFKSHHLHLSGYNRQFDLLPRFMEFPEGIPNYTENFTSKTVGFVGWLPFRNRQWDWAVEKKQFKDFCAKHDLLTPDIWPLNQEPNVPYIFKTNRSSFAMDILGPYHPGETPAYLPDIDDVNNDYYSEAFIAGKMAKAWFVEDKLSCLEITDMASVTGDGQHTIKELISISLQQRPLFINWQHCEVMLAFQGLKLDDVLIEGKTVLTDFRLTSVLRPLTFDNRNVVDEYQDTAVGQQYTHAGKLIWPEIPEHLRKNSVYSLDAIIDHEDRVWFLEVNCCPALHPDVYKDMLVNLFELDSGANVSNN